MASSHAEALPDKRMMRIHELRSKVILGDLPPDFLRLSQQVDQQAQQQHQAAVQAQHGQQHPQQVMSPEEYARYAQMNPMVSYFTRHRFGQKKVAEKSLWKNCIQSIMGNDFFHKLFFGENVRKTLIFSIFKNLKKNKMIEKTLLLHKNR